jgi:hypothetical protein
MKYLLILLLVGCSTAVPLTAKFPEAPEMLMKPCPQLEKANEDGTLSEITKTITNNYTTYYECAVKNDGWIEWYKIQKNIFESVK